MDLSEILFKMQNTNEKQLFQYREKKIMFLFIIVYFILLGASPDTIALEKEEHKFIKIFISEFINLTFLCMGYFRIKQLKKYHKFEYEKNKTNMWMYYGFVVVFHFMIIIDGYDLLSYYTEHKIQLDTILDLGFDKFFFAYHLIVVKRTQDPFEGLSKLDALIIISRNQIQTESMEENLYTSESWSMLTPYEK